LQLVHWRAPGATMPPNHRAHFRWQKRCLSWSEVARLRYITSIRLALLSCNAILIHWFVTIAGAVAMYRSTVHSQYYITRLR
jgi:hypothetical protein